MSNESAAFHQLVPNRVCGSCTACCKELTIRAPELRKLPGVLCEHCRDGCAIYEARPDVCREWYCAWRMIEGPMGDEWRPDRSGILATFVHDDIPEAFGPLGIKFCIIGGNSSLRDHPVLSWEPLLRFVGAAVEKRFPVFLYVPAPPGYAGRKIFLNDMAAHAAMMHDKEAMISALREAYRAGAAAPKEPVSVD